MPVSTRPEGDPVVSNSRSRRTQPLPLGRGGVPYLCYTDPRGLCLLSAVRRPEHCVCDGVLVIRPLRATWLGRQVCRSSPGQFPLCFYSVRVRAGVFVLSVCACVCVCVCV